MCKPAVVKFVVNGSEHVMAQTGKRACSAGGRATGCGLGRDGGRGVFFYLLPGC